MRVELSKALSILSHEVRGSLGVIQGYLRMLRDGVADPALSARMLQAMQDATTRITAVAREASELAAWTDGRSPTGVESVPLRRLLDDVARAAQKPPDVRLTPDVETVTVRSEPPGVLTAALTTVLQAARSEAPGARFALSATATTTHVTIAIAPEDVGRVDGGGHFAFDRGGFGLSLVFASHVLAAHGGEVTTAAGAPAQVAVRLPRDGGSA